MRTGNFRFFVAALMAAVAIFIPEESMAQRGEKSLGIKVGYNTHNESAIGGLYFQYRFSRYFRIAPDVEYVFRHSGKDALSINCNAHVPFALAATGRVNIYPLAGLNYTSWNYHPSKPDVAGDTGDDVSSRVNRLGINVGAGLEYYIKPTLKIAVEGKYAMARHDSFGGISLSIGYIF